MKSKLSLSEEYGEILSTRSTAREIFNRTNKFKLKKVELDFTNIEFISRSFCDEFLKQKEKSNKEVECTNINQEVKDMLKIVAKKHPRKKVLV